MVKKWSEVAYSDLNSIRIVFDVADDHAAGDRTTAASLWPPLPAAGRTIVWSAEHSKTPLVDLVNSLPSSTLDRVRDEEVLDLTYTFSTGPVGPPPPRGSAPWDPPPDDPAGPPALPAPAVARPPQPLGTPLASWFPFPLPASAGGGYVANGGAAAAAALAVGSRAPLPAMPGLGGTGNGSEAAVGITPVGWSRASKGQDAEKVAALRKHYTSVNRRLSRQGIASAPVTHFLPGGLFAQMHTAAVAGAIGAAAMAGGGAVAAASALTAATAAAGAARTSTGGSTPPPPAAAAKQSEEKEDEARCGSPEDDQNVGGGCEYFGDDGDSEAGDVSVGEVKGGELMGENTCMALFGGNGVELLVDASPALAGTGGATAPTGAEAGGEKRQDAGAAEESAVQPSDQIDVGQPPTAGSATPLAASGQADANDSSTLPLPQPSLPPPSESAAAAAEVQPAASPSPSGDSALMGEETCMALFGGEGGVELLVDPPPKPAEPVSATQPVSAIGEAGEGTVPARRPPEPPEESAPPMITEREAGAAAAAIAQPALPPTTRVVAVGVPAAEGVAGAAAVAGQTVGESGMRAEPSPLPRSEGVSVACGTGPLSADIDSTRPTGPATGGRAAMVEAKPGDATPPKASSQTAGPPRGPPGELAFPAVARAGEHSAPPLAAEAGAASSSPAASSADVPREASCGTESAASGRPAIVDPATVTTAEETTAARAAALPTAPDGGGAKAIAAPSRETSDSAPVSGGGHGKDKGIEKPREAKEKTPTEETPSRTMISAPPLPPSAFETPAVTAPKPTAPLLSPASAFKMGTLPTRARFGRPPTPSAVPGPAPSALLPAGAEPSEARSSGPSETGGAQAPKPGPPSIEKLRPSLAEGGSSSLGREGLSSCVSGRSEPDQPGGVVATSTTGTVVGVASAGGRGREAEALRVSCFFMLVVGWSDHYRDRSVDDDRCGGSCLRALHATAVEVVDFVAFGTDERALTLRA